MQHHGVDRVSLLQLKQELLHSLDGVVATQVDDHFLYLKHVQTYRINLFFGHYLRNKGPSSSISRGLFISSVSVCAAHTYKWQQCRITADSAQADEELQGDPQVVAPPLVGHQSVPGILNLWAGNLVSVLIT